MYLSLEWLRDFVEIPKNIKAEELGDKLTIHTVEIDGVEKQTDKYQQVVVGEILEVKKHPKADKLQLAVVDTKTEKLNIVCGAPNIKKGQKVPVALVGAVLPGDFEIKPATIRGEESHGMLCAEDELGLGDDHSGIMQLDESAKSGTNLVDYLKLKDVIFEVDNKSITNRPDLWSHFGMAREIATFLGTKRLKDFTALNKQDIQSSSQDFDLKVKIEDKKECSRYMAVSMSGIKIEPSPKWMQTRLIATGIKPINNIVDVTNYVMLELGQPMHAFDAKKIKSKDNKARIVVRKAKTGEKMQSLDKEERELTPSDLVIANDKEVIALAGLMGGENSEIDEKTENIILESANFNGTTIRKTSSRLALRTEASQRFEKSLDPNFCEQALVRSVELIKQLCPKAEVNSKIIDEGGFSYQEKEMTLDLAWLEKFLGKKIGDKKIVEILDNLGFQPKINDNVLQVKIPSWRATKDISIKEDIAEEIARIYGYDNIEAKMPKVSMQAPFKNYRRKLERKIRDSLSLTLNMLEVSNYSFVGEKQLKKLGIDNSAYIRLANPISQNHTMLRQTLATNLFNNVKTNQAKFDDIRIFEIGNIYLNVEGSLKKSDQKEENLPLQEKRLGILLASNGKNDVNYLNIKGAVNRLLKDILLREPRFCQREKVHYWANEKYVTEVKIEDAVIGIINKLDTSIAKKIGIKREVVVAELYLPEILKIFKSQKTIIYKPTEKYPSAQRDLSFILDESIAYDSLKKEIENFHKYIKEVKLFDEYHGDKLGAGKKSLAFHIIYRAEKTLSSREVDEVQNKLLKHFEEKFEAKVRDF